MGSPSPSKAPAPATGSPRSAPASADITDASRQINEEEIAACEETGVEYVELEIAIDGLTVATNPANEAITCLDIPALYALVGPGVRGHRQLERHRRAGHGAGVGLRRRASPMLPLDITGPGEESGTYDTFVEFAIADLAEERGQDEATRADYSSSANDNLIVEGIESSGARWAGSGTPSTPPSRSA